MKCNLVNENFSNNYIRNLMKSRGIDDFDDYVNPSADHLQSPYDLKNIGQAAALYLRIVMKDKPPYSRILIIVD